MRNALSYVPKPAQAMVSAALRTAFELPELEAAHRRWRDLIEVFESSHPRLAALMESAEEDVLAYKHFPPGHHRQLHSTNPLERLNKEIKRRTRVVAARQSRWDASDNQDGTDAGPRHGVRA